MSVLIKGMEMPATCCECFANFHDVCQITGACLTFNEQYVDGAASCPLIEVPPHGRLGDLDRLYKHIKAECNPYGKPTIRFEDGKKVMKIIADTRTVIEAEGE